MFHILRRWDTSDPYYEFDSGLGLGLGVGPIMYYLAEEQRNGETTNTYDFFNLPVNADARYNFLPKNVFSPYIRAGIRKNIASGDYVESDDIGLYYGVGAEFRTSIRVHFGLEIAKDDSEVEFKKINPDGSTTKTKIKPTDLLISFYVIF